MGATGSGEYVYASESGKLCCLQAPDSYQTEGDQAILMCAGTGSKKP